MEFLWVDYGKRGDHIRYVYRIKLLPHANGGMIKFGDTNWKQGRWDYIEAGKMMLIEFVGAPYKRCEPPRRHALLLQEDGCYELLSTDHAACDGDRLWSTDSIKHMNSGLIVMQPARYPEKNECGDTLAADAAAAELRVGGVLAAFANSGSVVTGSLREGVTS